MLMSWQGLMTNLITIQGSVDRRSLCPMGMRPTPLPTFYVEVSCARAYKRDKRRTMFSALTESRWFSFHPRIQPNFDVGQTHGRIRHGQSWPQQPQWAPTGIIRLHIYGIPLELQIKTCFLRHFSILISLLKISLKRFLYSKIFFLTQPHALHCSRMKTMKSILTFHLNMYVQQCSLWQYDIWYIMRLVRYQMQFHIKFILFVAISIRFC